PSVAVTAPPPAAAPVSAAPLPTAQAQPTRPPAAPVTTAPVTTPAAAAVRPPVVETRPQQPPATTAAAPPPAAQPQAAPPQSAPPQTEPAQPPPAAPATQPVTPTAAAAARPPATLTAVSPLTARRGGKVLLDLHGTGLHDGLRATIVAIKEAPRGITIMRQKCPSDTLMNVLLDIDANAAPGAYAIVVDDPAGQKTKPLTFTVAR
ncbi:MAG TPA: hypothetical protein VEQ10_13485, partial [Vicinamibacteria bacterium]|nr:hypothetical protein [Vicinamibacteria bacterium]